MNYGLSALLSRGFLEIGLPFFFETQWSLHVVLGLTELDLLKIIICPNNVLNLGFFEFIETFWSLIFLNLV